MSDTLNSIFCVDDDADILEVLRLSLETVGGYAVTGCTDPLTAVERIEATHPDLIVLDVMMPGMDGPATLANIRKNPALNDIPVVFMTARAQTHDVESYLALGAAGVITKPFDPMSVAIEVESLWRRAGHG